MKQDFINKRFGRLTIIKERPDLKKENSSNRIVECLCDCGLFKIVFLCNLKQGLTKSCGCLQKESSVGTNRTHGLTNTQEYNTWTKIKYRCYNKNGVKIIIFLLLYSKEGFIKDGLFKKRCPI